MTTRGVSDDGEGVEGAQMSRDERGREKEDGQAISGPAHRLMLSLRCVGFSFPQHLPAATVWRVEEWSKDLDQGGWWP